jgi:hypothetical protein
MDQHIDAAIRKRAGSAGMVRVAVCADQAPHVGQGGADVRETTLDATERTCATGVDEGDTVALEDGVGSHADQVDSVDTRRKDAIGHDVARVAVRRTIADMAEEDHRLETALRMLTKARLVSMHVPGFAVGRWCDAWETEAERRGLEPSAKSWEEGIRWIVGRVAAGEQPPD